MSNPIRNEYHPVIVSLPGETLLEILEEKGMSQTELAARTGRPKKTINEIIKGKAAITADTAIQFELVLGTPASFWNNREQNYRDWLARQEQRKWLEEYLPWMKKFPLRAMINHGWIKEFGDPVRQLEELLMFFGVASPVQWQSIQQATQWRQSPTFAADPAALSVWLRMGEIEAQNINCEPYHTHQFKNALKQIRDLTDKPPEQFVKEMVQICAKAGVVVAFLPEITGTRTCGATRWLTPTKAQIMLSLRYKTDDHLWFTFFHEAAHILLHGKKDVFIEEFETKDDGTADDKADETIKLFEAQADHFAAEFLIPETQLKAFHPTGVHISHDDIIDFAARLGLAPGIVVARLQHAGIVPLQNFNKLKRRFRWDNERQE